ncbi:hypothetical protein SteCoe_35832 [Stentor coeruleus]|uniref:Uncharacterized protein n=1 Tax=Stentor coeruleus TaxID=5963 RepID=A0A1R2ARQ0_9CILI|nr:hypothetical protein SteCoe_35832 [Stentor coeruleus]
MANEISYGDIKFKLEKGPYVGGQEIKGFVIIQISKEMNNSLLQITFEGNEKSFWREEIYSENGPTEYLDHGDSKSLAYVKKTIHKWENNIFPGTYTFSFSFILPQKLPSSFLFKAWKAKGLIKYYIRAEVISSTNQTILKKEKIEIVLPAQGCNGPFEVKTEASLRSCCILNRGICKLSISQQSDSYNPSEKIIITANINNSRSLLGTKALSGKLCYNMLLKSSDNTSMTFKKTLIKQKIPCVEPPKALNDNRSLIITLDLLEHKELLKTMHSYNGTFIDIYFYIKVKLQVKGFFLCSGGKPIVEYPVKIIPEPIFIVPNREECDDFERLDEGARLKDRENMINDQKENLGKDFLTENNEFGDKDGNFICNTCEFRGRANSEMTEIRF